MRKLAVFAFVILCLIAQPTASLVSAIQVSTPEPVPSQPLAWPIKPADDTAIAQARQCDMTELAKTRYPEIIGVDDLAGAYQVKNACDWATLAVAYATRRSDKEPISPHAINAFKQAVSRNAAFAHTLPILSGYFGITDLVEAPPFAKGTLIRVEVHHKFSGLGTPPIDYSYVIDAADLDAPIATGHSGADESTPVAISGTLPRDVVQAIAGALTDFIPVRNQFSILFCFDDYPDWTVNLTFRDGTTLDLVTKGSNIFFSGGPWQTEINGQPYVQYSAKLLDAFEALRVALTLPEDETAAMYCGGPRKPPFDLAFGELMATPEAKP